MIDAKAEDDVSGCRVVESAASGVGKGDGEEGIRRRAADAR